MAQGSNYPNENVFKKKKIYWILSKFAWFINHKWHLNLTVLEKKICFQKKMFCTIHWEKSQQNDNVKPDGLWFWLMMSWPSQIPIDIWLLLQYQQTNFAWTS